MLSHRARPEPGLTASPAASFASPAMSGCRVFIGRLNPAAREKDVERFFKGYGRIRDIDLKRGFGFVVSVPRPGLLTAGGGACRAGVRCAMCDVRAAPWGGISCRVREAAPCAGSSALTCFAFAGLGLQEFEDPRDADDAVYELDGKELCSER